MIRKNLKKSLEQFLKEDSIKHIKLPKIQII